MNLQGLDPDYIYEITAEDRPAADDELMYIGLDTTKLQGDFTSNTWVLKEIENE
jgi:hypothetical protein